MKRQYENILVSEGFSSKLQFLPIIPELIESTSFVFDDLSEVEKFGRLNTDKAIRSEDKDVLLALRTVDGETFPASLLKPNQSINLKLDANAIEKEILGVFRISNNHVDQLSINEKYITDWPAAAPGCTQHTGCHADQRHSQCPEAEEEYGA